MVDNPEHLLPSRVNQLVILVADDEPIIRNIARIVLEREGYFILTAGDGEEALLLSRVYPGTIHLFLTDVGMPKLDGLQLRERLREERPAAGIVLMSGRIDMDAEQGLRKPFGPDVLKERVRLMLLTNWIKGCGECQRLWREYSIATVRHIELEEDLQVAAVLRASKLKVQVETASQQRNHSQQAISQHEQEAHGASSSEA
jgi:DNA-binding response OmpR family regulator